MRFPHMTQGSFEDGYADGWRTVAGDAPLPDDPTRPPPGEPSDFTIGFEYGRADALERFEPDK
jgi:hypothetical protein